MYLKLSAECEAYALDVFRAFLALNFIWNFDIEKRSAYPAQFRIRHRCLTEARTTLIAEPVFVLLLFVSAIVPLL